jgi:predicted HTH domain antitoxin
MGRVKKDEPDSGSPRRNTQPPISGVTDLNPRPSRIDWDEAVRLYVEERRTFAEIARRFGYSPQRVRQGLAERGIESRSPGATPERIDVRLAAKWQLIRKESEVLRGGRSDMDPRDGWRDLHEFRAWAIEMGFDDDSSLKKIRGDAPWSKRNATLDHFGMQPTAKPLTAFGETKSLAAWERDPRCVVTRMTLVQRLEAGATPEDAIGRLPSDSFERARATRRKHRPKDRVDWELAKQLYESGKSSREIAEIVGVSSDTVLSGLRRQGVAIRVKTTWTLDPATRALYLTWSKIRREGAKAAAANPPLPMTPDGYAPIDPRWAAFEDFLAWAHANGWKSGLGLGRIDKTTPFTPQNCRWMSKAELTLSRRKPKSTTPYRVLVTAFGETKGLTAWAADKRCRVSLSTLFARLNGGLHPEDAIAKPPENEGRSGQYRQMLDALGESKSVSQWLADPRCKVSMTALLLRLKRGWSAEDAISRPPFVNLSAPPAESGQP